MSGTLGSIYNNTTIALRLHAEAMARLQEQVSTGSRINRVSDDPSSAYRILGLNSQKRALENYVDNISDVVSLLEFSSTVIEGIAGSLTETKTRITQIISGIYDDDARKRAAEGINEILEQTVMSANSKHMNQYIFGGSDTASAPYVVQRDGDGKITGVTYQGGSDSRNIEMAPGVQSSVFYVGDDIFRSDERSCPQFILDNTGAAAGTGTSSVSGYIWLEITQPGGPGTPYRLSIDDDPTNYTEVTVPPGDTNTVVTHAQTGEVLYVDTSAISTGIDLVSVPGTHDVFNTLITIRDMLENERGFSNAQVQQMGDKALESLDEVSNLLLQTSVALGSKIGFLDSLKDSVEAVKFNAEDDVARLEDADIAQIAVDLSRREVLYQMSLSVAARLMSMSLLDFIR